MTVVFWCFEYFTSWIEGILYRKKVWLIFASTMIYSVILVASELSVAYFLASIIDTVNPNLFHEQSVNWIVVRCNIQIHFVPDRYHGSQDL